jgi:hypothetical protein
VIRGNGRMDKWKCGRMKKDEAERLSRIRENV